MPRPSSRGRPAPRLPSGAAAPIRLLLVLGLMYGFLVGISLVQQGIGGIGPSVQDELFASVRHPLAGLSVGILATVLVQSSSVTTATIVGLVGSGLLDLPSAVPMIMGANIGTTVTSTLAALGHIRRPQEFRLAFAAATVHDFYNLVSVAILLPLELLTGVLSRSAEQLSTMLLGTGGTTFDSPLATAVGLPAGVVESMWSTLGAQDSVLALLLLASGLALIFACLALITKTMRALMADRVERALNDVLARGGGVAALVVGLLITVAVQSSTITTSLLIPLAASGVLALRNAYPVTVGANVGTTLTAVLASLASTRPEALTIALVHVLFNVASLLLLYPVPALREIPIRLANGLAGIAVQRRQLVAGYVVGTFIVLPIIGVFVLG